MMKQESGTSIPRMRTIKEVSAATGISYDAIRKMCLRKEIAHIRCGNKILVNLDLFIEHLNHGHLPEPRTEEKNIANQRIRKAFDETGLPKWKIADRLGIHYSTLCVWMRHEMPEEKQEKILRLIREESEQMRKEETSVASIDALAEQNYAAYDPQFQDQDAYDKDEWLDVMEDAADHINDALLTLQRANEIHEFRGAEKIARLLTEASSRLEEER